jgi:membrane protein required for colicin V production
LRHGSWRDAISGGYIKLKPSGAARVNWVDIVVISVVSLSAILAFMRGFVREVLGIGSWLGAGLFAVWAFPYARGHFRAWFSETDVADLVAFGALFVVSLFLLSLLSGMVGGIVRASSLGGIDRTFGIVFGLVRGAGVLAVAYIVVGMAVPLDRWPDAVQEARTLPFIYQGALIAVALLPEDYRPVVHVPAGAHETKAADLLRVNPQGRAVARP